VPAADVRDRRPVAVRRDDRRERRAHDRLGHERRDGPGAGGFDGPLELRRELLRVAEGVGAGLAGAIRVRRRDVAEPTEPGLVRSAQRLPAGEVQRPQGVAVVAPPPGEDDPALGLAASQVIGPRELERGFHRLGATGDGVDRRGVHREVGRQRRRVPLQRLAGECRAMGVGQAAGLLGHDPRHRLAPVADPDDDRAARRVEVGASVRVPDGGALGAHRHGWRGVR
jgi:hypothetical protein